MSAPLKVVVGTLAAGGVGTAGVSGTYIFTKVKIINKVEDIILPSKEESSWQELHQKLITDKASLKIKELKDIVTSHPTKSQGGGNAIKNWCNKSYSETYYSIFSSENTELLENVKKYCSLKISEKLAGNNLLKVTDDTNANEFKANYKALSTHNEIQDGKLSSKLLEIKGSYKTNDENNHWGVLKDWCKNAIDKPFKGENDDFKVTKKVCSRT